MRFTIGPPARFVEGRLSECALPRPWGKRAAASSAGWSRIRPEQPQTQETDMQYFVTGATGFIGKRLVKKLLARRGSTVYFLLREESRDKLPDLLSFWGASKTRAIPVFGDLTAKKLGVAADEIKKLKGQIDHVYPLAAVYHLKADEESQVKVNIEGTRALVEFAQAIDAGHVHHVSFITAAAFYE